MSPITGAISSHCVLLVATDSSGTSSWVATAKQVSSLCTQNAQTQQDSKLSKGGTDKGGANPANLTIANPASLRQVTDTVLLGTTPVTTVSPAAHHSRHSHRGVHDATTRTNLNPFEHARLALGYYYGFTLLLP